MEDSARRVLALLDDRPGHVHQTEGILQCLGDMDRCRVDVEFRSKGADNMLRVATLLRRSAPSGDVAQSWLGRALSVESRKRLFDQPRPDAVLSTGSSLAAPNLLLSRVFGCRSIVCTRPSPIGVGPFDLAILPRHQWAAGRPGDVLTTGVPTPITPTAVAARRAELEQVAAADGASLRPAIGLLMGGDDPRYRWSVAMAEAVVEAMLAVAARHDMQVAVATSRRTPADVEAFIKARVADSPMCAYAALAHDSNGRSDSPVLTVLARCVWVAVTIDSFTMVCEAASSGIPVGLIEVKARRADRYRSAFSAIEAQTGMVRMRLGTLYEVATSVTESPPNVSALCDAALAARGVRAALGLIPA